MQIALELGVVGELFPIVEGNFKGGLGWRKVGEADWYMYIWEVSVLSPAKEMMKTEMVGVLLF